MLPQNRKRHAAKRKSVHRNAGRTAFEQLDARQLMAADFYAVEVEVASQSAMAKDAQSVEYKAEFDSIKKEDAKIEVEVSKKAEPLSAEEFKKQQELKAEVAVDAKKLHDFDMKKPELGAKPMEEGLKDVGTFGDKELGGLKGIDKFGDKDLGGLKDIGKLGEQGLDEVFIDFGKPGGKDDGFMDGFGLGDKTPGKKDGTGDFGLGDPLGAGKKNPSSGKYDPFGFGKDSGKPDGGIKDPMKPSDGTKPIWSGVKPGDKPKPTHGDGFKPEDKPYVKPQDKPQEKPQDKPQEKPQDKPQDKPEKPQDKPEKPQDKPDAGGADKPDKPKVDKLSVDPDFAPGGGFTIPGQRSAGPEPLSPTGANRVLPADPNSGDDTGVPTTGSTILNDVDIVGQPPQDYVGGGGSGPISMDSLNGPNRVLPPAPGTR